MGFIIDRIESGDRVRDWLIARGEKMRSPGGYSNETHEAHQGIVIDGFEFPPTVEPTHNPPYYGEFLERYGFHEVKDYHAYRVEIPDRPGERLRRIASLVRTRRPIETRSIDLGNLRSEVDLIVSIYNEAWSRNWGFPLNRCGGERDDSEFEARRRSRVDPVRLHRRRAGRCPRRAPRSEHTAQAAVE